jgi:hypothetical protein
MKARSFALALSGLFLAAGAHAAWPTVPLRLLGDTVSPGSASESIAIGPKTRYVNVSYGDIVRFVVAGKSFGYDFDGAWTVTSFDLRRIAPAGLLDHRVMVYIEPDEYNSAA